MSWINYTDSEVNVFHPVCEEALNIAVSRIKEMDGYIVEHHKMVGTLEMDFAVNDPNGKIFCVIEVKRTPSDVTSTRFQYQAMSYVQSSINGNANPYYILTNLEKALFFRYSDKRPEPYQQILEPGISLIGSFEEEKEDFIEKLASYFAVCFNSIAQNQTRYDNTLRTFASCLTSYLQSLPEKRSFLSVSLHKYIYTVLSSKHKTNLRDTLSYRRQKIFNIKQLNDSLSKIDFKPIFARDINHYKSEIKLSTQLLSQIEQVAQKDEYATLVSSVIYDIEKHYRNELGEIPTNPELARFLAILSKIAHNREVNQICDPAAGSGNLIFEAAKEFNIKEGRQILANDICDAYSIPLALRLGLFFGNVLTLENSPTVLTEPMENLSKDFFRGVSVVVMNPPFISGVASKERKRALCAAIGHPQLNISQMPYEGLFLELLVSLLPKEATIAIIFPTNHLLRKGEDAQALRKFLLKEFSLTAIVTYPMEGLFSNAKIDTCILIGKPSSGHEVIHIVNCNIPIADIDMTSARESFAAFFNKSTASLPSEYTAINLPYEKLEGSISDGWHTLIPELNKAEKFVEKCQARYKFFVKIKNSEFVREGRMKRGPLGNSGASDFLFVNKDSELYKKLKEKVRGVSFKPALHNSKVQSDSIILPRGDSLFACCPIKSRKALIDILTDCKTREKRKTKQSRKEKSAEQIADLMLGGINKKVNGSMLLLARAGRKRMRCFVTNSVNYLSTNVIYIMMNDTEEALIVASWISTLFYQVMCFLHGNNYGGMQKMEMKNCYETLLPDFSALDDVQRNSLVVSMKNAHHVELRNPEPQEIDYLWARYLFGDDDCNRFVAEATELLWHLSNEAEA